MTRNRKERHYIDMAIWQPHYGPQREFCSRGEFEILYGGAAGGGKTDALIMEALRYIEFPKYKGLIMRRTFTHLQEIIDRTRQFYPAIGGDYRASEHRWYFPSGSSVKMGHMQHEGSEYNYQGQEYQYIAFDEACQLTPKQYLYLFSRARSTDPRIPSRVRGATNPGGPCHQFLKDRFRIGHVDPGITIYDDATGLTRSFIPAKLSDNPSLLDNDPNYLSRLMQLPEIERKRLIDGLWDAFEGQKFPELNEELHGDNFEIPPEWECFGAFDWGYARPWAYGIFRVDYDGRIYLDRLFYGTREDSASPNIGLRMTDSEIAREIKKTEGKLKVRYRVAGHDIFSKKPSRDGTMGPSPAENMAAEGVIFIKADNNRIPGWQQIHHRLKIDEDGQPWFFMRKSLRHAWRTMAAMPEDPANPEDILNKDIEDHIPEMIRYGLMTRPMVPKYQKQTDKGSFQAERRRLLAAKKLAARQGISLSEAYQRNG